MNADMQDKDIEVVRQALHSLIVSPRTKRPQSKVAKALGISQPVLSAFLGGQYAGNNQKIALAAQSYMDKDKSLGMRTFKIESFVETSVSRRVQAAHDFCFSGKISLAYGPSGIGKTKVLKHLATLDPAMVLVQVTPCFTTQDLLRALCAQLKCTVGTLTWMVDACAARLHNTNRILAIDEAEYLSIRSLDTLRRIHDFSRCGVLLVGMPRLNYQFRDMPHFKQIDNRIRLRVKLDEINLADTEAMVRAQVPECAHVSDILHVLSKGDARRLESILEIILQMVDVNGGQITREMCEQAVVYLDEGA